MLLRRACSVLMITALVALPLTARASETDPYIAGNNDSVYAGNSPDADPNGLAMAADLVIARPLGLVATTLGGVFYLVALPFMAFTHDVETPARKLVSEPSAYTFQRPLGQLGEWR